jgi:hypothetical protein
MAAIIIRGILNKHESCCHDETEGFRHFIQAQFSAEKNEKLSLQR